MLGMNVEETGKPAGKGKYLVTNAGRQIAERNIKAVEASYGSPTPRETNPEYYTYSAEWEAEAPYFDRETQAELARRAIDMDAGRNIVRKKMEELEAMAND